ncbi:porin [uncultured Azohydromonas sp.]|jgi:Outer membrane protein (porin)|uniref:porin n=1 Tax=uncultured Azohydromonas sp. TaxID=487342 RepID=UPI00262ACCF8|nr:porin [uncultured Azohydromonas sp.]
MERHDRVEYLGNQALKMRHRGPKKDAESRAAVCRTNLKLLLAVLGAAGAWSGSSFAQQSSVTVYGLVDVGVEYSNSGKGGLVREISGGSLGSRVGFRGTEDLGGGLSANFRLEQGFTADNGVLAQGGRIFGREASVGLSSKAYGTVLAGRLPTPYYQALNGVDAFSWVGSGGMLSATRSTATSQQLLPLATSARTDNAIGYTAPAFGGLELKVLGAFGEGSTTIGRHYSAAARYRQGPVDAIAAYARQDGAGASGDITAFVVGGSYNLGPVRIYAGHTREKNECSSCTGGLARVAGVAAGGASEFRLSNLGVKVPLGATTVFAQVTRIDDRTSYAVDPGSRDATWFGVGAEHALSKRTTLYATAATVGNRNGSSYALGSGTAQQGADAVGAGDPRSKTAVIGIRHVF